MITVLCASRRSVYKSIPGLDVYDEDRDARTFTGPGPVIAHPPCRCWSAFCRHQARPLDRDAEMDLGRWCVRQVQEFGGVLEQPAHSRLFFEMDLPFFEVSQAWFGDSREKSTWLYFSGISLRDLPRMPFALHDSFGDRRRWQLMSSGDARSATPLLMAQWLVDCCRVIERKREAVFPLYQRAGPDVVQGNYTGGMCMPDSFHLRVREEKKRPNQGSFTKEQCERLGKFCQF